MVLTSHKKYIIKQAELFIRQLFFLTQNSNIILTCITSLIDDVMYQSILHHPDYFSFLPFVQQYRDYLIHPDLFLQQLNSIEPIQSNTEDYLVEFHLFLNQKLNEIMSFLIQEGRRRSQEKSNALNIVEDQLTQTHLEQAKFGLQIAINKNEELTNELNISHQQPIPESELQYTTTVSTSSPMFFLFESDSAYYSNVKFPSHHTFFQAGHSSFFNVENANDSALPSDDKLITQMISYQGNNDFIKKAKNCPEDAYTMLLTDDLTEQITAKFQMTIDRLRQWHDKWKNFTEQHPSYALYCKRYLRKVGNLLNMRESGSNIIDHVSASYFLDRINELSTSYRHLSEEHILKQYGSDELMTCFQDLSMILMSLLEPHQPQRSPQL